MHASDLIDAFFQGGALQDYIIHFTNELDPNGLSAFRWPQYTTNNPNQLIFSDSLPQQSVEKDTYRQSQMDFLTHLSLNVPS
jgi:carboxylesterase type B